MYMANIRTRILCVLGQNISEYYGYNTVQYITSCVHNRIPLLYSTVIIKVKELLIPALESHFF